VCAGALDSSPRFKSNTAWDAAERTIQMTVECRKFDKMSNLTRELEKIERKHAKTDGTALVQARSAVVSRVSQYRESRYQLGRVLHNYKIHFKAEGGWVVAAQAIAEAINRDERTVYRIIDNYECASKLPPVVLQAMEDQKIDPAAAKNAGLVQRLAQMPEPATRRKADSIVARVRSEHITQKKAVKAANERGTESVEEFSERVLRHFKDRFSTMPPQQRDSELQYVLELIVNTLRSDVRELKQFGRPALVPKPKKRKIA